MQAKYDTILAMQLIKDKEFGGERPLFATHDLRLENVTITDGESGIKQCQRMEASNCCFYGKYPSGAKMMAYGRARIPYASKYCLPVFSSWG